MAARAAPRRSAFPRRSRREWLIRGALAALAALLGYLSVSHTLAKAVAKGNVELARRLAPGDGRVLAAAATSFLTPGATAADRQRAERLAHQALRQDATAVSAVSTLGLAAQVRGDVAGARRLFAYAERLSRRDLPTQLWAIEDAVGRGDVRGALRHYDIALRTSVPAADLLFPVLTVASADPAVRGTLIATLAAKPLWADRFVSYATGYGKDPVTTAQFLFAARRAGVAVPPTASAVIVNALIVAGRAEEAWRYYVTLHAGADRRRSRDPGFAASTPAPTLLDWTVPEGTPVSATIQPGVFDFSAPAGVGGAMLQQVQLLPPGDYLLGGHGSGIDPGAGALPYWSLACRGGAELGRVAVPASGGFSGRVRVPAGCPIQTLTLVAQPADALAGIGGQIDRVLLAPAR